MPNYLSQEQKDHLTTLWVVEKLSKSAIALKMGISMTTVAYWGILLDLTPHYFHANEPISANKWPEEFKKQFTDLYLAGVSGKDMIKILNHKLCNTSSRILTGAHQLGLPTRKTKRGGRRSQAPKLKLVAINEQAFKVRKKPGPTPKPKPEKIKKEKPAKPIITKEAQGLLDAEAKAVKALDPWGHVWEVEGRCRTCIRCNNRQYKTTRFATLGPIHNWLPVSTAKCHKGK